MDPHNYEKWCVKTRNKKMKIILLFEDLYVTWSWCIYIHHNIYYLYFLAFLIESYIDLLEALQNLQSKVNVFLS